VPGNVAACALCRARCRALVGAVSGRALAPPVSLCLAAAAIRLLLHDLKWRLGKSAELWLFTA
jgi:hypothetical protein